MTKALAPCVAGRLLAALQAHQGPAGLRLCTEDADSFNGTIGVQHTPRSFLHRSTKAGRLTAARYGERLGLQ